MKAASSECRSEPGEKVYSEPLKSPDALHDPSFFFSVEGLSEPA